MKKEINAQEKHLVDKIQSGWKEKHALPLLAFSNAREKAPLGSVLTIVSMATENSIQFNSLQPGLHYII